MTPRKSFESKGFHCEFCPGSYKHKGSKTAHIRKKHTVTLTEAGKLTRENSIEKNLNDGMEVLEEAGVAVDLLDMDPMEESETPSEESAMVATNYVIETVLNTVHSSAPLPTIASAVPACAGAASFFLLNPEQPIIDLTSSQRSLVLPPLPDILNDTIEELEVEVDNMVEQFQIKTSSKSKCGVCSESFSSNTELTRHMESHQKSQSFQTLAKYSCAECDFEHTSRDKFKEHMKGEHTLETDNEDFELGHLKSWSPMPPAVEARRKEATRSKEAKEAAKKVKETRTEKEAAMEVRDPAHLAHWSGSVLGDYLESMKTIMNNQSRLLDSLHAKQDWQSKEILKLQILLITQEDSELNVETAKTPKENEEIKENQEKEREPTNSENTERQ